MTVGASKRRMPANRVVGGYSPNRTPPMFASINHPSVNGVDVDSPPATALMSRALPAAHPAVPKPHLPLGELGTSRKLALRVNPSAPKNWIA